MAWMRHPFNPQSSSNQSRRVFVAEGGHLSALYCCIGLFRLTDLCCAQTPSDLSTGDSLLIGGVIALNLCNQLLASWLACRRKL